MAQEIPNAASVWRCDVEKSGCRWVEQERKRQYSYLARGGRELRQAKMNCRDRGIEQQGVEKASRRDKIKTSNLHICRAFGETTDLIHGMPPPFCLFVSQVLHLLPVLHCCHQDAHPIWITVNGSKETRESVRKPH